MTPRWTHIALALLSLAFVEGDAPCSAEETTDSLLVRAQEKPLFAVDRDHRWRSIHIANAAVLAPDESPDGLWRLFIRGSGRFPEEGADRERNYHDSIGLFTQEARDFSPLGPWKEHSGNPVIFHGPADGYDGKHLLDCAPVWGKDRAGRDTLFMFYKGVSYDNGGCLAGASSIDGKTFTKFDANPLQQRVGPCDVVFHRDRYYIFYGDAKYDAKLKRPTDRLKVYVAVIDDPTDISDAERHLAIDVGPPGAFDSRSVHGARIFRLRDRWFAVYQCSAKHFDYPDRFHVAHSIDLIRWTKVDNDRPFFTRGARGQWDQGAIWFGEVFEHGDRLWMYYEGWGWESMDFDRDRHYAKPGRSQTGAASASTGDFLKWCGLSDQALSNNPIGPERG